MSSNNKPKDEAERLANKLVECDGVFLRVGGQPIVHDGHFRASGLEMRAALIRHAAATVIREAIEGRDRIMTDLLSESEAFHEGWRAMSEELVRQCRLSNVPNVADFIEEMTAKAQPPSKNATGEILSPSPVHLRAQRMELALRAIAKIQVDPVIDFTPLLTQIAREALREPTNE